MNKPELSEIISLVAVQQNMTEETVKNQLIDFMDQKYMNGTLLEERIIESAKMKILQLLYEAQGQKIGNGYYGWHVPSYRDLLYQFAWLDAAEKMYFDQICEQLIEEDLIYTKCYAEDKHPTTVGLTKKGILFYASLKK
ncbi:MAG: hypothetical protein PHC34_11370 [Candidatus Gastranaerophilales bacterium]|nr:hypothetical protein [Candidatus Gastranaerophilales bacterium]